jgi:hypothetical protein
VYAVSVKLSHIYRNYTKVDEIQGTYGGMASACNPEIGQHFQALSLSQEADFLLEAGCTSEFEVFPQPATFA